MNILNLISKQYQSKSNIILAVLFVIYGLFFVAFLPWPSGINWGLDPSWKWGISQVAKDNLIFGKEIVFTYGPFGYLIHGAAFEDNYWHILAFRFLIHFLFFIVLGLRILTINNITRKILFLVMVLVGIYLTGSISIDYKILFTYLTIFTFEEAWNKYKKELTYFMSIIVGFCLLTKFTLGIATLGFLIIYTSVNLFNSIKSKSIFDIKNNVICLISVFPISVSSAWLFLIPKTFFPSLILIIINLILSFLISFSISSLVNKKNTRNLNQNHIITIFQDKQFTKLFSFLLIYSVLTAIIIFFDSSQSLIKYLYNCWQISSGFSSAMSIVGNKEELLMGIIALFFTIFILYLLSKNGNLNLSLGLLFVTWISFKHGFVRQDPPHVFNYIQFLLFILPLCFVRFKNANQWKNFFFIYLYTIVISFISFNYYFSSQPSIFNRLNHSFKQIITFDYLKEKNQKYNISTLSQIKMSDEIQTLLANKSIDIIPWDLVLVPANNLNWKPRPIFQSYSAYTSHLDNLNYESFVNNPRDFLLYSFQAIDGRHPFFDEPKTFSFVHCNYGSKLVIGNDNWSLFLLDKLSNNICLSEQNNHSIRIKWTENNSLESLNNSTILKGNVKIKYTLFGKIYKTVFRVPPVTIKVQYLDDSQAEYRIIPENADNGVILSHLPRNDQEVLSFFSDINSQYQVKSFSFHNQNHLLYQPDIEIQFSSYQIKKE